MSSRPLFRPQKVANAVSMDAAVSTPPSNINMVSQIGYTISWTDGAAGAFSVEVSNDYVPSPPGVNYVDSDNGTWVPIALSEPVESDGNEDSAYIDVVGISAAWIRLTFTPDSPDDGGTFTATVAGKVA